MSPPPRWWRGWAPVLLLPLAVFLVAPPAWPRWIFMWGLAVAVYCGCKWLTWRRTPVPGATPGREAGYLLLWPGMDAAAFLNPHPSPPPARPGAGEWAWSAAKAALGLALFFGVARRIPAEQGYLAGWAGMIGIILVLHFGTFHLLSCAWRRAGVEALALMNRPLAAVSVGEFWGRRWNRAFRDLTHRFLFRPLAVRLGARRALAAGFVFSGALHELVISVPAGGGYGGPTLFFALQAGAMLFERSGPGLRLGLGRGGRGRAFTLAVLILPACGLFHPPFVRAVILPMMRSLGALA